MIKANKLLSTRFYVDGYEETISQDGSSVGKSTVGNNILHIRETNPLGASTETIEYLHRDHLGSVESITDQQGQVLVQFAFEPYGERRQADWLSAQSETSTLDQLEQFGVRASRGFTGHEHLDRTGFIHMNGRVYDPVLGRFLSPDPIVVDPTVSQHWNRLRICMESAA